MPMKPLLMLGALAAFLAFSVACGSDDAGSSDVASPTAWPERTSAADLPTSSARPTATVAGCTAIPGERLGKTTPLTVMSGGIQREYLLHLPPNADQAKDGPIVLNFHGLGSNMGEQQIYSGLAPIAEREGFVLVTPNGTGSPRAWQSFGLPGGVDDLQFVRDLLAEMSAKNCIDTSTVFATGMSNGAFMSSYLACRAPELVKAIAPVAGVFFPRQGCTGRTPVLAFHGTDDAVVPYEAGEVFNIFPYAGAVMSTYDWATNNGCAPTPDKTEPLGTNVGRINYTECGADADVSLVRVTGGGHTWPGTSIDRPNLGVVNREISASEMAWDFFEEHAGR